MTAYYNEHDPYAAQWLRNLIKAGHIAPGIVDERSIEDVRPDELSEFTQCHFFAGIGVWSYALRQAGWPDDRPVWTGSCPCQPFSNTGKGGGFTDERHLWPALHWLIQQRQPGVFFGEQVASKDGLAWLDLVQIDLENTGYACGPVDLCSAGVGSPNIRQRQYIAARRLGDTIGSGLERHSRNGNEKTGREEQTGSITETSITNGMANTTSDRRERESESAQTQKGRQQGQNESGELQTRSEGCAIPDTEQTRGMFLGEVINTGDACPTNGFWRAADWLGCRDGKWRPVEPGTSPLADGIDNRVGRLRAYGNAINAEVAKEFIKSYMEIR